MSLDLDRILKHELYIQRMASGGLNNVIYPSLDATLKAVKLILSEHDVVPNITELNKITRAIAKEIESQKGWATLTTSMETLATYEAGFQASVLGAAFAHKMNVPEDSSIVRYVTKSIMSLQSGKRVDAGIWSQFVKANIGNQADTINKIVINAYGKGQPLNSIVKDIQAAFTGTIKSQAESLARTGFAHYTAQANEAMIKDNADILKEYYYVTVFDNRTSEICIGIEKFNKIGNRYSVGDKSAPFPPLHFQCRTRRIATAKDWQPTGDKASVGSKEGGEESFDKRKDRRDGKVVKYSGRKDKSFKAEPISAKTTRDKWLKKQELWFIQDLLGKKRADLFLNKGYSLGSFSDMTGRPLTLDEIIKREK